MMTNPHLYSDLPIPPGNYIAEVLQEMGLSQAELARRMGRPIQAINEIIQGTKAITSETALQLEKTLGLPAVFWLGLENLYRLAQARQQEMQQRELEVELLKEFPYREMVKRGWVAAAKDAHQKVGELQKFLGVASLRTLPSVNAFNWAFRKKGAASPYAIAAWIRYAELQANQMNTAAFDMHKLRAVLPNLRRLTLQTPQESVSQLKHTLASCGVSLVIEPHLPKTYAHGAVFWSTNKPILILSFRGKWADIFWFTLFHELGHLVLHGKRPILETDNLIDKQLQRLETEADCFAQDTLIKPDDYKGFVQNQNFTPAEVVRFAQAIDIHSGVVVGRLQHDGYIARSHLQGLRQQVN